jgi:aminoglycoside phosphotransferase family enzyme/predicted kinase
MTDPRLLLDPACYPHPAGDVGLITTHISWVFLAGEYAYKVKRPVSLPFLDFRDIESRRRYCNEELRINRRTAPELYLDVVPIVSTPGGMRLGGTGEPVDYAVRMRRFSQEDLAVQLAERGALSSSRVDALAAMAAAFHSTLPPAEPDERWAAPALVAAAALENFDELGQLLTSGAHRARLARLRDWTERRSIALAPSFGDRKRRGFVRECHGDLHLRNIVFVHDRPVAFDAVEFDPALRWIDVINDAAFLAMDLHAAGLGKEARRFMSGYLEHTGDYGGSRVLRFYLAYRALVRAKVSGIQSREASVADRVALEAGSMRYIRLAESFMRPVRPRLFIMHGLAGSGKSTIAQWLVENLGAFRIRSDVERKRLHGLGADARTQSSPNSGIYTAESSGRTYERLLAIARAVLGSGYSVVVDAAFLSAGPRARFHALAAEIGVPFEIVSCHAPRATLERRVLEREATGKDASEAGIAILASQSEAFEHLLPEEARDITLVPTDAPWSEQERRLRGMLRADDAVH